MEYEPYRLYNESEIQTLLEWYKEQPIYDYLSFLSRMTYAGENDRGEKLWKFQPTWYQSMWNHFFPKHQTMGNLTLINDNSERGSLSTLEDQTHTTT